MSRAVRFRPRAETDLSDLYDYIAQRSGTAIAGGYIERIQSVCMSLADFPERGTKHDEIRPGLRVLGFERRAVIVFQVLEEFVVVVRIFYGGRDYERLLKVAENE